MSKKRSASTEEAETAIPLTKIENNISAKKEYPALSAAEVLVSIDD